METDYAEIMLKEKLEFLDILKEALKIPCKHINFIIFTLFSSFPYLCLSVFFEFVLHRTLLDTFKIFEPSPRSSYYLFDDYFWEPWVTFNDDWHKSKGNLLTKWIKLCLLYSVPCHLLGLINLVMTVNATSMICAGDQKRIGVRDMMVTKTRFKGPFITSIYVLLLSTCFLLGLVGVVTNWYILTKGFVTIYYYVPDNFFFDSLTTIFHIALFIALLVKYSEWSAGWNMALVISVLQEKFRFEAFELSAYFSKGSTRRGLLLMLVFVVWELVLRLPCLFGRSSERLGGIVFTSGLIFIGNLMKWVVCVLYFFDCKKRILEKKVDEEIGRGVKVVNIKVSFCSL